MPGSAPWALCASHLSMKAIGASSCCVTSRVCRSIAYPFHLAEHVPALIKIVAAHMVRPSIGAMQRHPEPILRAQRHRGVDLHLAGRVEPEIKALQHGSD